MAHIATTRENLVDWILDVVLFKSGLRLSESELLLHVRANTLSAAKRVRLASRR